MSTAQDSEYTVIIANDGFEYVCKKKILIEGSKYFKSMLESSAEFSEAMQNQVTLPEYSSLIVQYVAIYLYFRDKYKGDEAAPALDFPPYLLLNLLMAADYLQC